MVTAVGRRDRKWVPAKFRSMYAKLRKSREVNCVAVRYIFFKLSSENYVYRKYSVSGLFFLYLLTSDMLCLYERW